MNTTTINRYQHGMETGDIDAVLSTFSDDIVIRVAVHDEPISGITPARFLFPLLLDYFEEFHVTETVASEGTTVVVFDVALPDYSGPAEGVNLVRIDHDGRIRDLTVFLRPLPALQRVAEHIGSRMAAQFGDLPDRSRA